MKKLFYLTFGFILGAISAALVLYYTQSKTFSYKDRCVDSTKHSADDAEDKQDDARIPRTSLSQTESKINFFNDTGSKQVAIENMKQVALALNNFKQNAARYPDDKSAEKYENDAMMKFEHLIPLKDETSNSYFRQLFANPKSKKSIEENQFYAKIPGVTQGDEDMSTGECLKNGENAFAYVLKDAPKAKVRTRTSISGKNIPLLFCGVKTDQGVVRAAELNFDLEAFGDYALMYTTSGQLTPLEVNEGLDKEDDTTGILSSDPFPKDSRTKATIIDNYVVIPPAL